MAAIALAVACGGSKAGSGTDPGRTPPGAAGGPTPSTEERVFAVDSIMLGEADRSGNHDKDAWRAYGFNLDGRITNVTGPSSPDLGTVCKAAAGANPTVQQDGDQGIDNAFGKEVLPLLSVVLPAPSKTVTDSIHAGTFTVLLKIVGLTDDPLQTNSGLGGTILVGGAYGSPPAFDQATDWPTVPGSADPMASAYINQGVFVSGQAAGPSDATVHLELHVGGETLSLVVQHAIISFKHDPTSQSLLEGTIAGVLDTEQFVGGVVGAAGAIAQTFCSPEAKQALASAVRQASDILSNGTEDPNATCNAISVGIGFTAKRVAEPTKEGAPAADAGDPCTTPRDAGADG
jgi:hypothetical protein